MTRHKSSCGQAYVLTILFLLVLLGMAAAVLDVGSWYRAHRSLQATVDAAALAGAQALPQDTLEASGLATEYAAKNGGGEMDITFSTTSFVSDTISVEGTRPAPGFFAKVFGIDTVTVRATAKARAGFPVAAKWVAPIVVHIDHPMLQPCGGNPPCSQETTLEYDNMNNPGKGGKGKDGGNDGAGSFGFINLTGEGGVGSSDLGNWISEGFDEYLYADANYNVSTGNPFSSNNIEAALEAKLAEGLALLFPIYDTLTGTGDNAEYHIVGFAAFVITDIDFHGENEIIHGHFTEITWDGILAESPGDVPPDFGVRSVSLVG
jgi:Putative Flp pilus-assembly TadE/G-like